MPREPTNTQLLENAMATLSNQYHKALFTQHISRHPHLMKCYHYALQDLKNFYPVGKSNPLGKLLKYQIKLTTPAPGTLP